MAKQQRRFATIALCALAIMTLLAPKGASAQERTDYSASSLNAQEEILANLVNEDRTQYGLNQLTLDPQLCALAQMKSEDMVSNGYFAHKSPTYGNVTAMLKTFGVSFLGCSENIARHRTVYHSDAAFLSSEMHRRNLLSASWTHYGVGVAKDANGFVYCTEIFIRR